MLGTFGAKKRRLIQGHAGGPQCNERHVYEPLEGITLRALHFLVPAVLLLKWVLWNRYIITVYLLCTIREIQRKISFALIISQAKNQFLPPKHPLSRSIPPLPPNFPPYRKLKDPCYVKLFFPMFTHPFGAQATLPRQTQYPSV